MPSFFRISGVAGVTGIMMLALGVVACSSSSSPGSTDTDANPSGHDDAGDVGVLDTSSGETGASCSSTTPCREGSVCQSGTCHPVAPDCAAAACDAAHICGPTGDGVNVGVVCVEPIAASGPCSYSATYNPCAAGLFCDARAGNVCKPQLAAGAECPSIGHFVCVDGYTCRRDVLGTPAVCTREVPIGGACLNDGDCVLEAQCKSSKCVARPRRGEPCTSFNECAFYSVCTAGVCSGHL